MTKLLPHFFYLAKYAIKQHHRKIIWSATTAIAIASSVATIKLNQQSAQFDQISQQSVAVQSHQTQNCDPNLWKYVYHPQRLPTQNDCRTVSGTVMWVKHEPDADFHIRLREDNPNNAPVNAKNIGSYLVVEPICQIDSMPQPTQTDAVQGCTQYVQDHQPQFKMPNVGDHITITGFYTLDRQHGWMEIHSATIILK